MEDIFLQNLPNLRNYSFSFFLHFFCPRYLRSTASTVKYSDPIWINLFRVFCVIFFQRKKQNQRALVMFWPETFGSVPKLIYRPGSPTTTYSCQCCVIRTNNELRRDFLGTGGGSVGGKVDIRHSEKTLNFV